MSGVAAEEVRPSSVEAIGLGEVVGDAEHAVDDLVAWSKTAFRADDEGHDAEAAAADGDEVGVAGDGFDGHAAVWFGAVPVVLKGGLLNHGEKFVVAHVVGGAGGFVGHGG